MTIDIGSGANSAGTTYGSVGYTQIDLANPANEDGELDTFEVYFANNGSNIKMGTFSDLGSGYFTSRDYENIGSVTAGSKQTFTGKSCSVVTGDLLGLYQPSGSLYRTESGGTGVRVASGDKMGTTNQYFSIYAANKWYSMYATGPSVSVGHPASKRFGGVPFVGNRMGVW